MGNVPGRNGAEQSATSIRSFTDDDRAIEGLPIRLVIAMIIGVASLGIMMQILGGVDVFESKTEVDLEFDDASAELSSAGSFGVTVVDTDGNTVEDADVIAVPGDAVTGTVDTGTTGTDGETTVDLTGFDVRQDAEYGTVEFRIEPPADTNWEDNEGNSDLIVT